MGATAIGAMTIGAMDNTLLEGKDAGMRWKTRRRSTNIEDRRGVRAGRGAGLGIVGILMTVGIAWASGASPMQILQMLGSSVSESGGSRNRAPVDSPEENQKVDFVAAVLGDTETTWSALLKEQGQSYEEPKLVLFRDAVRSACGTNSSAVGPFYCPADRKVYLDLSFFDELHKKFGAPGDFAQAYVIAHEVGHHLQTVLGISARIQRAKQGLSRAEQNAWSVKQELQADCFAGIWAHHADKTRDVLERGDVEEGLRAAAAIGDDTLQRKAGAEVAPESWTHGSSEQRVRWFKRGMTQGTLEACDTLTRTAAAPVERDKAAVAKAAVAKAAVASSRQGFASQVELAPTGLPPSQSLGISHVGLFERVGSL